MASQFRDTQFGRVVRHLSKRKLFKYPDETDPSLWKKSLRQEGVSKAAVSEDSRQIASVKTEKDPPVDDAEPGLSQSPPVPRTSQDAIIGHGKDIFLVDWYGPDDPENPQNWPSSWQLLVALQICLLNFAVYMGSSIYVPGESEIMRDFGVSQLLATLGLSLFTVGYGLGPILWSPMSEMPKLGRNDIYFWTLFAFVVLQLPTGFAVNMPMFLVFRLLTGFCGSPCLSTGGGTLADMYDPASFASAVAIYGSFGILGPVFGPIIGGFVAPAKGWRWTIWVVTWGSTCVLVMFFFLLPETSAPNILYRRAKRLRRATGDDRLKSQSEIDAEDFTTRDHLVLLGRACTLTFSEPIVFVMDLYTALLYGILFTWFESFPLVFGGIYHFDTGEQGLVFLGIFVGGLITLPLFLLWIKRGIDFTVPNFKPEMVLPPTFFGAIALPICLFFYGWTSRENVPWIVPIIGSCFFTVSIITLFNPILNYLGISYPAYAASIFAGNALFRATFGAIFPLFARQLFHKLGIGPGNSLLGGIAICFLPIPYIFYKYGPKIRSMSKTAQHDS